MIQYLFEVGGSELDGTYPITTDIITDSIGIAHSKTWQIQAGLFSSDGRVEITLQQSSDNVMWDDMRNSTEVTILEDDSITFEDSFFSGRYLRIKVEPKTLSNGLIKIILTEKV
jgi:hypothetical protein